MAHASLDLLEDIGFVNEDLVSSQIRKLSSKKQSELRQMLRWALHDELQEEMDDLTSTSPFTFLASSQFRGDRCCSMPDCRLSKIPTVSRFSALYADQLIFPVLLGTDNHVFSRDILEGAVKVLLAMRPLIRAGIVLPTNVSPNLCRSCYEGLTPLYSQAEQNLSALVAKHVKEFKVEVKETKRRKGSFEYHISGPTDFLSEGTIVYVSPGLPKWAIPGEYEKRTRLQSEQVLRTGVLENLFEASVRDFVFQNVIGTGLGATYLTNQVGEAEFFSVSPADYDLSQRRMEALDALTHELPAFSSLSINQIIALRKKEGDAFLNYRNAVSKALHECEIDAAAGRRIPDLMGDIIRPQLEILQGRDSAEKKSRRSKVVIRMGLGAFVASFGALMSGLHPGLGAAIGAAIACLNPTAVDDVLGAVSSSPEVRANSLYFLLSAKKMASHD